MQWLLGEIADEQLLLLHRFTVAHDKSASSALQPAASSLSKNHPKAFWNVHIKAVKISSARESFAQYRQLLSIAEEFLVRVSPDHMADILNSISRGQRFNSDDLERDVEIEYFSEGGSKYVFKVTLRTKDNAEVPFLLIAKKEKREGSISESELDSLRNLYGAGVPKFGEAFKTEDGQTWFMEEFIKGPTANQLQQHGPLSPPVRKSIVTTLLTITLGFGGLAPRDAHARNFVIRDGDHLDAVMVDVGEGRWNILGSAAKIEDKVRSACGGATVMGASPYRSCQRPVRRRTCS